MDYKKITLLFGAVLIVLGFFGFIPGITYNDLLFGQFLVGPFYNFFNILNGSLGIWSAYTLNKYIRFYFKVMTLIYGIVLISGFITGLGFGLDLMPLNFADNILHLAIVLITAYFGFFCSAPVKIYHAHKHRI